MAITLAVVERIRSAIPTGQTITVSVGPRRFFDEGIEVRHLLHDGTVWSLDEVIREITKKLLA